MRILIWHVHGSWTTSFVQGPHTYLLPTTEDRGPDGLGRARTWRWPPGAVEVDPGALRGERIDLVVLQRPHEEELLRRWTGLRCGRDVPAVYLEHNTPEGGVPHTRHPAADRPDLTVVHVTHFNALMWDCGSTRTHVIEHGIVDPGPRWTGELPRAAVAVNDPLRRGRATGTDLLPGLAATAPTDVFGMRVAGIGPALGVPEERLTGHEDPPQHRLHRELPRRGVYVHTPRWTSLGLSLLEAMHLAMPVAVLAATEAPRAVPPGAGTLAAGPAELYAAARRYLDDPALARDAGLAAREAALARYGLKRFLDDWDGLLLEVSA
ncbi:glycosyltransferase [Allostreptomyces psammosilenae]|uniref:Glycosyl transferase n=1 Tax=Allostreptomyces psammosilenae TaxID=1892865 RepID=A0A853A127_9ACTN|nr:glycosyltransferase [Allostreptomyces psammosilenae]NYI04108.1 hypothetical protein [Allostreptomyces psammosilenae]